MCRSTLTLNGGGTGGGGRGTEVTGSTVVVEGAGRATAVGAVVVMVVGVVGVEGGAQVSVVDDAFPASVAEGGWVGMIEVLPNSR